MEIEKTLVIAAEPEAVWAALLDPQLMAECVPGMQSVEVISPDEYRAVIAVKLAFISARFKLNTRIVEQRAPAYLRAEGTGEDKSVASALKQTSELFLTALDEGQTELRARMVIDVTGRLSTFGLSAMKTKADRLWEEFCANLGARLSQRVAPFAASAAIPPPPNPTRVEPPVSVAQAAVPRDPRGMAAHPLPPLQGATPPRQRDFWFWLPGRNRIRDTHIQVELRRDGTEIRVLWPVQHGQACLTWLREMMPPPQTGTHRTSADVHDSSV